VFCVIIIGTSSAYSLQFKINIGRDIFNSFIKEGVVGETLVSPTSLDIASDHKLLVKELVTPRGGDQ